MSDNENVSFRGEDPRIERTRHAVRRATLQVLADRGYAAFTVEAVAGTARVAKSTIYRHWPTRIDLISDALQTLNRQPSSPEAAASIRDAIEHLLVHLAKAFSDSVLSSCMPALIEAAEHHPEVAAFLHKYSSTRRQTLVDLIRAGVDSGDLPGYLDPDLASLALAGPIIYRRLMTPGPFPADQVDDLLEQVLGPEA